MALPFALVIALNGGGYTSFLFLLLHVTLSYPLLYDDAFALTMSVFALRRDGAVVDDPTAWFRRQWDPGTFCGDSQHACQHSAIDADIAIRDIWSVCRNMVFRFRAQTTMARPLTLSVSTHGSSRPCQVDLFAGPATSTTLNPYNATLLLIALTNATTIVATRERQVWDPGIETTMSRPLTSSTWLRDNATSTHGSSRPCQADLCTVTSSLEWSVSMFQYCHPVLSRSTVPNVYS